MQKTILIADDEKTIRETIAKVLREVGYKVLLAQNGREAVDLLATSNIDVALLDIRMPEMDGMSVLAKYQELSPETQIIMITAFGTVENAVNALELGADDYVTKPFVFDEILIKIERLLDLRNLTDDKHFLLGELENRYSFEGIIGDSHELQKVLEMVEKLAQTRSSTLISGESGTGKELIARAIHYNGITKEGRLIAINCAAMPESLAESELFGHKKGAFTGATSDKTGLLCVADGGTVFLDEICSMPLSIQAKLLRAIENKTVLPVGATEPVDIDARILCATNRDLKKEMEAGRFREDLYYRLSVVEINVPPLRERREDIPQLVTHFIEKYNRELNKNCPGMSPQAMRAVMAYSWPGNIRELSNVIERAMIFTEGRPIAEKDLSFAKTQDNDSKMWQGDLKLALRSFEKQYILQVLRDNNFDKHLTSRLLGVGLSSLYRKMDQLRIPIGNGHYEPVEQTSEPQEEQAKPDDPRDMLKADSS